MTHREDSSPAFGLGESRQVRTDMKTIGLIVAGAFVVGGSWFWVKSELAHHGEQIAAVASRQAADHDILTGVATDVKSLLREQRQPEDRAPSR